MSESKISQEDLIEVANKINEMASKDSDVNEIPIPKRYEYKTRIVFKDKINLDIITVEPPKISQFKTLVLLQYDRLTSVNIDDVRMFTTEQLGEIKMPEEKRIIT